MKTLIELYDRNPIYNYLASLIFKPERVVFVGAVDEPIEKCRAKTKKFAHLNGLESKFEFAYSKPNDFADNYKTIKSIIEKEKSKGISCVIDVTGGRDLALVAAGSFIDDGTDIIYLDKANSRYLWLPEGKAVEFDAKISCETFITIAGGTVFEVARSHSYSEEEEKIIKRVIDLFFEYRDEWTRFVKYLQQISKKDDERDRSLYIDAPLSFSDNGRNFEYNEKIMCELEKAGAIRNLNIIKNKKRLNFSYMNGKLANLLVNEGVWLELKVYFTAKDMPCFSDVNTGVKFVWDIPDEKKPLSRLISESVPRNEVDAVLSRGLYPVFISCKTRAPFNEDLNELYAIKEKFGGDFAKAIITTTKPVDRNSPIYERAQALGIGIIDEKAFENNRLAEKLDILTGGKRK